MRKLEGNGEENGRLWGKKVLEGEYDGKLYESHHLPPSGLLMKGRRPPEATVSPQP